MTIFEKNQDHYFKTFALRLIFIFLFIISFTKVIGQQLSIPQTIEYLNKTACTGREQPIFILEPNGYLKYQNMYSFYFNDVEIYPYDNSVRVVCNGDKIWAPAFRPKCIKCINHVSQSIYGNTTSFIDICGDDTYTATKLFNALSYLFTLIKEDPKFKRDTDDPFAPSNYNPNATSISGDSNETQIQLTNNGGVFEIWVSIKGIKKKFILDSGASDVSISQNAEQELIQEGILKKEYYIEPALYQVANGSIIKCRRFTLPELRVGDFTVKNIRVAVGINNTPLLLGKSFLDKFSKWTINNLTNKLILEK